MEKPIVGISCGDLNGISMEVIVKTFENNDVLELCTPVVFASSKVASYHRKAINAKEFSFNLINDLSEINPKKANLLNIWKDNISIDLGKPNDNIGQRAIESVDAACSALLDQKVDVIVTAPLNKNTVKLKEGTFRGHTEYLGEKLGGEPLMVLISETLKVALVTGHIALKDVSRSITQELLTKRITQLQNTLIQDFGISKPKIAVLGLNPHAGDGGVMGKEEQNIITPTIEAFSKKGHLVFGPFPSDGFFGMQSYTKYDAVLAMYHDQGLAPFKTISFDDGVNYTAGLNYVRTSPDHGTGYDIAGKGIASETSFRNALYSAIDIYRKRKEYTELTENVLKKQRQAAKK